MPYSWQGEVENINHTVLIIYLYIFGTIQKFQALRKGHQMSPVWDLPRIILPIYGFQQILQIMALIRRFQPRMVGTHLLQGLVEDLLLGQQRLVSLHAGLEICLEAAAGGEKTRKA